MSNNNVSNGLLVTNLHILGTVIFTKSTEIDAHKYLWNHSSAIGGGGRIISTLPPLPKKKIELKS